MPLFVYTCIFTLALPLIVIRLWWKERKTPGYRKRISERFGFFTPPQKHRPFIWVHAVSVGEVVAATPLIRRLIEENGVNVVVTTTTPTGSARVYKNLGEHVFHVYTPFDIPFIIRNFLKRLSPELMITIETELWPNILNICRKKNIPTIVANARLSERSKKKYAKVSNISHRLMTDISVIAAQTFDDGERFLDLGLAKEKLHITGSIKFDIIIDSALKAQAHQLRIEYSQNKKRCIFIAASTHPGEDEIIVDSFKKLLEEHPALLLILVPRHPENFQLAFDLCKQRGLNVAKRSDGIAPTNDTQVIVGDTMGELVLLYGIADIAFVGGSLIERGGHNMIEPAAWGKAIISGKHTFNFSEIAEKLTQCQGMAITQTADEIFRQCDIWLKDKTQRERVGINAKNFVDNNQGALDTLLCIINQQYER